MQESLRRQLRNGLAITLMLFGLCALQAEPSPQAEPDFSILKTPASLHLNNGRTLEGQAVRVEAGKLIFKIIAGTGEVEYTVSPESIDRLDFPGDALKAVADKHLTQQHPEDALAILQVVSRKFRTFD